MMAYLERAGVGAVQIDRRLDQSLQVSRHCHVAGDGEPTETLRLPLERFGASREQHDVRALLGERFRDSTAYPRGRSADDGRPALQVEIHALYFFLPRTATTSRTAAAEVRNIFRSSAVSLSVTTSSTPPAPSLTGTPM